MDWSVNEKNGMVTVSVTRPRDDLGLYRAYAVGVSGARCLLGTLTPQADRLTLRRTLSADALRQRGCYPVAGVDTALSHAFRLPLPPLPGWSDPPSRLPFSDDILSAAYAAGQRSYYQATGDGFALAYPYKENVPFPLPPLFCLAQTVCVCGQLLWRFSFDSSGNPHFGA